MRPGSKQAVAQQSVGLSASAAKKPLSNARSYVWRGRDQDGQLDKVRQSYQTSTSRFGSWADFLGYSLSLPSSSSLFRLRTTPCKMRERGRAGIGAAASGLILTLARPPYSSPSHFDSFILWLEELSNRERGCSNRAAASSSTSAASPRPRPTVTKCNLASLMQ